MSGNTLFVHIDSLDMSLISPRRLRIQELSTARFECKYRYGYWRHSEFFALSGRFFSSGRILTIPNVTISDSGYYCCVGSESLEACSVLLIISEVSSQEKYFCIYFV